MGLFRRKPPFLHPCPYCQARGYEAPHRGQHQVAYIDFDQDGPDMRNGHPVLHLTTHTEPPPRPPLPSGP